MFEALQLVLQRLILTRVQIRALNFVDNVAQKVRTLFGIALTGTAIGDGSTRRHDSGVAYGDGPRHIEGASRRIQPASLGRGVEQRVRLVLTMHRHQ